MTITQLEYIVAVATYRSFVAAAEKCFVTQPTLSMQIQKLEDEFGVKLFDRGKQPIAVTPVGELIVAQAKNALAECQKINELVQQQQNKLSGEFRLAIIPTVAPYVIPSLLKTFTVAYPDVFLNLSEMETKAILIALRNNEIDAALLSTPLEENDIKEYPLFYEPFIAYFSEGAPALSKKMVHLTDLDLKQLWLLNEGHCMRNQVLDLCSEQIGQLQKDKPYRYESSNVETLRKMVDHAGGFTILPELATFEFNEDQQERIRYFDEPEPAREVSLVTAAHFVRLSILEGLSEHILQMVPEKMRVQKKNRKVLRIQSSKL